MHSVAETLFGTPQSNNLLYTNT